MYKIQAITYKTLLSSWPGLEQLDICFIKDWTAVFEGLSYYVIVHEKSEKVAAAFYLFFSKRKGLEHVSNAPFFQTCGLVLKNTKVSNYDRHSFNKRVLKCMSEFVSKFGWVNISLPHTIKDLQPFIWDEFTVTPRYTYLLDISVSRSELNKHFSKGLRSDLAKLEEAELALRLDLKDSEIRFLAETSASHRPESEQRLWNLLMEDLVKDDRFVTLVVQHNKSIGIVCIAQVGEVGVYLFGNSDKKASISLNSASLIESINLLKSKGVRVLDFEGSMIPGIERYFRSFGGELTPYFNIVKEPRLVKTARLLKG